MSLYYVLPLVCFLTFFTLGFFVLLHRPRTNEKRVFSLLCFEAFYWQFVWFISFAWDEPKDLDYLAKISYLIITFLPFTFYHFIAAYLRLKSENKFIVAFYGFALFLVFLLPTDLFVTGHQHFSWGNFASPGPVYPLFMIAALIAMTRGIFVLSRARRRPGSYGVSKKQVSYIFLGLALYYLCAVDFAQIFGATWYPVGVFFFIGSFFVISYAILRHQLLDIEVIIKKTLVFTGLFAGAMAIVAGITTVTQSYLGEYLRLTPMVSTTLSVFIAILLYDPVRRFLERLTENVLFQKKIDYEKIEEDVSNSIKITDLDKLCQSLVGIFYEGLKLTHVILFLYDEEKRGFRIGAARGIGREPWLAVKDSDSLVQELRKEHTGTVYLKADLEGHQKALSEGLDALRCEALAKVVFENRLIALLCLGKKKSDEDYTSRDQQLLFKTANQMAVSISHAATFRLQRDYYVLQAQRNRSDALSRLSEGLDHEIKNPLNQIRPRLENVVDYYESKKLTPECPHLLESLETSIRHVDRISKIMERLRKFARPVEGEKIKLVPVRLKPFVEEAIGLISEKQLEIDTISIELDLPDNLSPLFAEETSLVQVFYNLIINAYHAIDRNGKIRISARDNLSDGRVVVSVSDTGKGMDPQIIDQIFEPFFTTKPTNLPPGSKERFTGTGLGLAFVQKYMEDLGGTVTVSSELGKGTTFYLKFLKA